ncbi:MAG: thiol:disulfide interchange protein DsbA/DsbL [Woeseia sp.]
MKYLHVHAFVLALILSGCGSEQAGPASTATADTSRDDVAQEAPAVIEPPAADEKLTPTLVEESSAEEVEDQNTDDVPLLLAQADTSAARDWQFKEGQQYFRLVPTQPTVGGADKIEVAEIFWYGCNHCYDFEPIINQWAQGKPANSRFVRIPAMWNPLVKLHAQLYYTEEVLAKNGKLADPEEFRATVFREYHQRGNRLTSEGTIQALFERFGVSAEDFGSTWKSFEVAQKMRVAEDLGRRYGITGVPAVVVNGKYRTGAGEAGGYPNLIKVIDELVERESIR